MRLPPHTTLALAASLALLCTVQASEEGAVSGRRQLALLGDSMSIPLFAQSCAIPAVFDGSASLAASEIATSGLDSNHSACGIVGAPAMLHNLTSSFTSVNSRNEWSVAVNPRELATSNGPLSCAPVFLGAALRGFRVSSRTDRRLVDLAFSNPQSTSWTASMTNAWAMTWNRHYIYSFLVGGDWLPPLHQPVTTSGVMVWVPTLDQIFTEQDTAFRATMMAPQVPSLFLPISGPASYSLPRDFSLGRGDVSLEYRSFARDAAASLEFRHWIVSGGLSYNPDAWGTFPGQALVSAGIVNNSWAMNGVPSVAMVIPNGSGLTARSMIIGNQQVFHISGDPNADRSFFSNQANATGKVVIAPTGKLTITSTVFSPLPTASRQLRSASRRLYSAPFDSSTPQGSIGTRERGDAYAARWCDTSPPISTVAMPLINFTSHDAPTFFSNSIPDRSAIPPGFPTDLPVVPAFQSASHIDPRFGPANRDMGTIYFLADVGVALLDESGHHLMMSPGETISARNDPWSLPQWLQVHVSVSIYSVPIASITPEWSSDSRCIRFSGSFGAASGAMDFMDDQFKWQPCDDILPHHRLNSSDPLRTRYPPGSPSGMVPACTRVIVPVLLPHLCDQSHLQGMTVAVTATTTLVGDAGHSRPATSRFSGTGSPKWEFPEIAFPSSSPSPSVNPSSSSTPSTSPFPSTSPTGTPTPTSTPTPTRAPSQSSTASPSVSPSSVPRAFLSGPIITTGPSTCCSSVSFPGSRFGRAVAALGDADGDGVFGDVAVGVIGKPVGLIRNGVVFIGVYSSSGELLSHRILDSASHTVLSTVGPSFGASLAARDLTTTSTTPIGNCPAGTSARITLLAIGSNDPVSPSLYLVKLAGITPRTAPVICDGLRIPAPTLFKTSLFASSVVFLHAGADLATSNAQFNLNNSLSLVVGAPAASTLTTLGRGTLLQIDLNPMTWANNVLQVSDPSLLLSDQHNTSYGLALASLPSMFASIQTSESAFLFVGKKQILQSSLEMVQIRAGVVQNVRSFETAADTHTVQAIGDVDGNGFVDLMIGSSISAGFGFVSVLFVGSGLLVQNTVTMSSAAIANQFPPLTPYGLGLGVAVMPPPSFQSLRYSPPGALTIVLSLTIQHTQLSGGHVASGAVVFVPLHVRAAGVPDATSSPTPTASASPTRAPTPSPTSTRSATPTPSVTATPTMTPSPWLSSSPSPKPTSGGSSAKGSESLVDPLTVFPVPVWSAVDHASLLAKAKLGAASSDTPSAVPGQLFFKGGGVGVCSVQALRLSIPTSGSPPTVTTRWRMSILDPSGTGILRVDPATEALAVGAKCGRSSSAGSQTQSSLRVSLSPLSSITDTASSSLIETWRVCFLGLEGVLEPSMQLSRWNRAMSRDDPTLQGAYRAEQENPSVRLGPLAAIVEGSLAIEPMHADCSSFATATEVSFLSLGIAVPLPLFSAFPPRIDRSINLAASTVNSSDSLLPSNSSGVGQLVCDNAGGSSLDWSLTLSEPTCWADIRWVPESVPSSFGLADGSDLPAILRNGSTPEGCDPTLVALTQAERTLTSGDLSDLPVSCGGLAREASIAVGLAVRSPESLPPATYETFVIVGVTDPGVPGGVAKVPWTLRLTALGVCPSATLSDVVEAGALSIVVSGGPATRVWMPFDAAVATANRTQATKHLVSHLRLREGLGYASISDEAASSVLASTPPSHESVQRIAVSNLGGSSARLARLWLFPGSKVNEEQSFSSSSNVSTSSSGCAARYGGSSMDAVASLRNAINHASNERGNVPWLVATLDRGSRELVSDSAGRVLLLPGSSIEILVVARFTLATFPDAAESGTAGWVPHTATLAFELEEAVDSGPRRAPEIRQIEVHISSSTGSPASSGTVVVAPGWGSVNVTDCPVRVWDRLQDIQGPSPTALVPGREPQSEARVSLPDLSFSGIIEALTASYTTGLGGSRVEAQSQTEEQDWTVPGFGALSGARSLPSALLVVPRDAHGSPRAVLSLDTSTRVALHVLGGADAVSAIELVKSDAALLDSVSVVPVVVQEADLAQSEPVSLGWLSSEWKSSALADEMLTLVTSRATPRSMLQQWMRHGSFPRNHSATSGHWLGQHTVPGLVAYAIQLHARRSGIAEIALTLEESLQASSHLTKSVSAVPSRILLDIPPAKCSLSPRLAPLDLVDSALCACSPGFGLVENATVVRSLMEALVPSLSVASGNAIQLAALISRSLSVWIRHTHERTSLVQRMLSEACVRCPTGWVNANPTFEALSTACRPCPAGTYAGPGARECLACPTRGANCQGGVLLPLSGWWVEDASSSAQGGAGRLLAQTTSGAVLRPCPLPSACNFEGALTPDDSGTMRPVDLGSLEGVNGSISGSSAVRCALGHGGPLCGVCTSGFVHSPLTAGVRARCVECTSTGHSVVVVAISCVCGVVWVCFLVSVWGAGAVPAADIVTGKLESATFQAAKNIPVLEATRRDSSLGEGSGSSRSLGKRRRSSSRSAGERAANVVARESEALLRALARPASSAVRVQVALLLVAMSQCIALVLDAHPGASPDLHTWLRVIVEPLAWGIPLTTLQASCALWVSSGPEMLFALLGMAWPVVAVVVFAPLTALLVWGVSRRSVGCRRLSPKELQLHGPRRQSRRPSRLTAVVRAHMSGRDPDLLELQSDKSLDLSDEKATSVSFWQVLPASVGVWLVLSLPRAMAVAIDFTAAVSFAAEQSGSISPALLDSSGLVTVLQMAASIPTSGSGASPVLQAAPIMMAVWILAPVVVLWWVFKRAAGAIARAAPAAPPSEALPSHIAFFHRQSLPFLFVLSWPGWALTWHRFKPDPQRAQRSGLWNVLLWGLLRLVIAVLGVLMVDSSSQFMLTILLLFTLYCAAALRAQFDRMLSAVPRAALESTLVAAANAARLITSALAVPSVSMLGGGKWLTTSVLEDAAVTRPTADSKSSPTERSIATASIFATATATVNPLLHTRTASSSSRGKDTISMVSPLKSRPGKSTRTIAAKATQLLSSGTRRTKVTHPEDHARAVRTRFSGIPPVDSLAAISLLALAIVDGFLFLTWWLRLEAEQFANADSALTAASASTSSEERAARLSSKVGLLADAPATSQEHVTMLATFVVAVAAIVLLLLSSVVGFDAAERIETFLTRLSATVVLLCTGVRRSGSTCARECDELCCSEVADESDSESGNSSASEDDDDDAEPEGIAAMLGGAAPLPLPRSVARKSLRPKRLSALPVAATLLPSAPLLSLHSGNAFSRPSISPASEERKAVIQRVRAPRQ
jgi:hypothetical protein